MAALLGQCARGLPPANPLRVLAEQLLARFPTLEAPRATLLISADEPLSPQEQRVLRLLGAGLSNPDRRRAGGVGQYNQETPCPEHLPQARREQPPRGPRPGAWATHTLNNVYTVMCSIFALAERTETQTVGKR